MTSPAATGWTTDPEANLRHHPRFIRPGKPRGRVRSPPSVSSPARKPDLTTMTSPGAVTRSQPEHTTDPEASLRHRPRFIRPGQRRKTRTLESNLFRVKRLFSVMMIENITPLRLKNPSFYFSASLDEGLI